MIVIAGIRGARIPPTVAKRLGANFDQGASLGGTGSGVAYSVAGYDPAATVGHSVVTVRYRGSYIPIVLGFGQG